MATYRTEIHTGGGGRQADQDLTIQISARSQVVPGSGAPSTGTTVTWSGDQGTAAITFFDGGSSFTGTARLPHAPGCSTESTRDRSTGHAPPPMEPSSPDRHETRLRAQPHRQTCAGLIKAPREPAGPFPPRRDVAPAPSAPR
ncbi:hypothetical protein [Saccharothrix violaceirubra]|uniref:OAA-family lectin sugar binding domain-containing protein n=1 Tax=Saccharothrix violaceirubra TaxID=413306 RepID=A0A7W7T2G7_9PSEU|nr:hypothetical protein [Saccharothrix violaceirubra]MBB4965349.1 hypothetical protein [Saccharothrix violaceirubra]